MSTEHPALFLHGIDGPVAILPARVCALLERHADLDNFRIKNRGVDAQVDHALIALHSAAATWRRSRTGTAHPPAPEPARSSWVTTTQAADALRVTSRAIRKAIQEGRLDATRVDDRWRITREDLEHFRARQTGTHR